MEKKEKELNSSGKIKQDTKPTPYSVKRLDLAHTDKSLSGSTLDLANKDTGCIVVESVRNKLNSEMTDLERRILIGIRRRKKKLVEAQISNESLQEELNVLQNQANTLTVELDATKNQANTLTEELDATKNQHNKVRQELHNQTKIVEKLTREQSEQNKMAGQRILDLKIQHKDELSNKDQQIKSTTHNFNYEIVKLRLDLISSYEHTKSIHQLRIQDLAKIKALEEELFKSQSICISQKKDTLKAVANTNIIVEKSDSTSEADEKREKTASQKSQLAAKYKCLEKLQEKKTKILKLLEEMIPLCLKKDKCIKSMKSTAGKLHTASIKLLVYAERAKVKSAIAKNKQVVDKPHDKKNKVVKLLKEAMSENKQLATKFEKTRNFLSREGDKKKLPTIFSAFENLQDEEGGELSSPDGKRFAGKRTWNFKGNTLSCKRRRFS